MSWGRGRRRWAYYGRNDSYSKSANAEDAEANGRFPKTRAAKALGLSVAAFNAGRFAIAYHPSEYHHVGRYATEVTYYDTNHCAESPEFWEGAAEAYSSKKRKAELLNKAAALRSELSLAEQQENNLAPATVEASFEVEPPRPLPMHDEAAPLNQGQQNHESLVQIQNAA